MCETNAPRALQIMVKPYLIEELYLTVEVNIAGEFNGEWFNLTCYGLKPEGLQIEPIERRLIAAWNALKEA